MELGKAALVDRVHPLGRGQDRSGKGLQGEKEHEDLGSAQNVLFATKQ